MEGKTSTRPAKAHAAVSRVLEDDDLLIEILLRVGFPTTLVCAALVCKRWLGHSSNQAFLRRFRELHPPRLLGFYITDKKRLATTPTRFIPLLPQPPELADVVRRACFKLDTYESVLTKIEDCRNGNVFVNLYNHGSGCTDILQSPLCPKKGPTTLPRLPYPRFSNVSFCTYKQVVSEDVDGIMSYYYLHVESAEGMYRLHVYKLQDGSWHHLLDTDQFPHPRSEPKAVLIDNKIYMVGELSGIIVLDLKTLTFSTIQLPQGVYHVQRGTVMLSRADYGSGVYLIHIKEFQLRIWLHKGPNWLLVDSICLLEMCANLRHSGCIIEGDQNVLLMNQVVDYGDFVFLKMGGCALHLDTKCRTLRIVYETENYHLGDIHPFMMIWPPTFPELKHDPTKKRDMKKKDTRRLMGGA